MVIVNKFLIYEIASFNINVVYYNKMPLSYTTTKSTGHVIKICYKCSNFWTIPEVWPTKLKLQNSADINVYQ